VRPELGPLKAAGHYEPEHREEDPVAAPTGHGNERGRLVCWSSNDDGCLTWTPRKISYEGRRSGPRTADRDHPLAPVAHGRESLRKLMDMKLSQRAVRFGERGSTLKSHLMSCAATASFSLRLMTA
jgi:hypothetical protein